MRILLQLVWCNKYRIIRYAQDDAATQIEILYVFLQNVNKFLASRKRRKNQSPSRTKMLNEETNMNIHPYKWLYAFQIGQLRQIRYRLYYTKYDIFNGVVKTNRYYSSHVTRVTKIAMEILDIVLNTKNGRYSMK